MTFVVVCKWADRRRAPDVIGHEALVLEAANAEDALLQANEQRPDLWEIPGVGFSRQTEVHPAQILTSTQGQDSGDG